MSNVAEKNEVIRRRTCDAFMWSKILNTPFWAVYNLLPYIFYKDLHATPLQITVIFIMKPAVSIIAMYWGALVENRKDRLVSNLIWARLLSHLPFFLFPFVDNPWFFIACSGFYMMLTVGAVPAWMEVLKLNVVGGARERIYAYGSAFGYAGAAIIPWALGSIMDNYVESWRWMFPIAATISLTAIFFKSRILITHDIDIEKVRLAPKLSIKEQLIRPWSNAWELMKNRPDFARYQLAFTLGGAGLSVMQPALPVFFMDQLSLTYAELAIAIALCKGIGFALASPTWAQLINRVNIYRFNGLVGILMCLFPLFLIAAHMNLIWLYVGYLLYGVMQAGNEMSWNLSGPMFAKNEDSSVYTSVNVLTVGLRGCFVPAVGTLLLYVVQASGVMITGALLCMMSTICMMYYSKPIRSEA